MVNNLRIWLKGTMRGETDFAILGLNNNILSLHCDLKNTGGGLLRIVLPKVRITLYKVRGQEWSRDNGAKNVSKKTIASLSFIM